MINRTFLGVKMIKHKLASILLTIAILMNLHFISSPIHFLAVVICVVILIAINA